MQRLLFPRTILKNFLTKELILKAIDSGNADKIKFGGRDALDPTVPSL